jgi:hypothetical protein
MIKAGIREGKKQDLKIQGFKSPGFRDMRFWILDVGFAIGTRNGMIEEKSSNP